MESHSATPQKGDQVSFHISDIYIPGPSEFIETVDTEVEVLGCIVDFSDSEPSPGVFAIVQTDERHTVIVPVVRLGRVERCRFGGAARTSVT